MQHIPFIVQGKPAGTDPLAQDLYSEQHTEYQVKIQLENLLTKQLPTQQLMKILIIGGRCGLTTQLLLPFARQIDVVEQEPYLTILTERFESEKQINYFFGREGEIGERFVMNVPNKSGKLIRVISGEKFLGVAQQFYNVVLLQNWMINQKCNLVKQFMKIDHDLLITMLVPGKIKDPLIFTFIADLQKHVLNNFYKCLVHQQLIIKRQMTGRRVEMQVHECYNWKKISRSNETQQQIKAIVQNTLVHFQDQCSIAKSNINKQSQQNPYETQRMVNMYTNFHFGEQKLFEVQNYPSVCAKISISIAQQHNIKGRALDLGCAVGRTAIDLAEYFDQVIGIDLSNSFIQAANSVLHSYPKISQKVKFYVGNACDLDKNLGKFNLIFGGNLIDRLYNPAAFLEQIGEFIEPNGILILASPYSWLSEYTSKSKWLGGIIQNGVSINTRQGLKRVLLPLGFQQIQQNKDIRFIIKENEWVYQSTLANVTFWIKTK